MMNKESQFVTPSVLLFYVYLTILTVVIAFLAPLFRTRDVYHVRDGNGTKETVKALTGYLTDLKENLLMKECFNSMTKNYCSSGEENVTSLEYPSTIVIVQQSVFCPFVLVAVICVYWEERRLRSRLTNTNALVIICISFEMLHILGFIFYPVLIGPEVGFTWNDLDMGFFLGLVNIVFVWIWLFLKIYIGKKKLFKRKYKTRRRKSDPIYIAKRFIFVDQKQNQSNASLMTTSNRERKSADVHSHHVSCLGYHEGNVSELSDPLPSAGNVMNDELSNKWGPDIWQQTIYNITDGTVHFDQRQITQQPSLEKTESLRLSEGTEEEKHRMTICIKSLIEILWSPELIGIGKDAHSPGYTKINIKTIFQVKNGPVWNLYAQKKKEILNVVTDIFGGRLYSPEEFGSDIKPVKTDEAFEHIPEANFAHKLHKGINEHYLFHGTDISHVQSIIQKGFDKSISHRTMLGRGIYFTDHPVKADQYTGARDYNGQQTTCCMILARVLLGNSVITKVRNSDLTTATSAPCKLCLSVKCSHEISYKFDSLIFDGGLFREYVVYDNGLAYPEFVIYYDRV